MDGKNTISEAIKRVMDRPKNNLSDEQTRSAISDASIAQKNGYDVWDNWQAGPSGPGSPPSFEEWGNAVDHPASKD